MKEEKTMGYCDIKRCIHFFDGDGKILDKTHVPYNPLIVLFNHDAEHKGTDYYFDQERLLSRDKLFYPIYLLRYMKKDWDWMRENGNLDKWDPDSSPLGTAMIVMGVKVVLYCAYRYDYLLHMEKNLGSSYYGKNYFHFNYSGQQAFDDMVKRLCDYLGVTYRGQSPYFPIHIHGRYGQIEKDPNLTDVTYTVVYEALYSLAYALWYNKDGARDRWRVDLAYLKKYDELTNEDYAVRGRPVSSDESFYGALKSAYSTVNAVLEINEAFQSLLSRFEK